MLLNNRHNKSELPASTLPEVQTSSKKIILFTVIIAFILPLNVLWANVTTLKASSPSVVELGNLEPIIIGQIAPGANVMARESFCVYSNAGKMGKYSTGVCT